MDNKPGKKTEIAPGNDDSLLTSIRDMYTLSNTDEVERFMVKHFLETLAEIAIAVASRNGKESS